MSLSVLAVGSCSFRLTARSRRARWTLPFAPSESNLDTPLMIWLMMPVEPTSGSCPRRCRDRRPAQVLETKPEHQLPHTRIDCRTSDYPEGRRAEVGIGIRKLRMIESIVELEPADEAASFPWPIEED